MLGTFALARTFRRGVTSRDPLGLSRNQ